MNLVDVLIVLFLVVYILRGLELGFLRQAGIAGGTIIGLFVGIFIANFAGKFLVSPLSKIFMTLAIIAAVMLTLATLGEKVGTFLKASLQHIKVLKILDIADRIGGAVVAAITLLVVAWFVGAMLDNVRAGNIQDYLHQSRILKELNKRLPPVPNFIDRVGSLIDPNNFPTVFIDNEPAITANAPLPSIGSLDVAVQATRDSVVKVEGDGCGNVSTGSGFVADTGLVVTNAHVVAGITKPFVVDVKGQHQATAIWFDPNLDIAILRTNVKDRPLSMLANLVPKETQAAALGYPGGQGLVARPAVVADTFRALGRNIYNEGQTTRTVYALKTEVKPGSSGGPLIDTKGTVIGVIFAESTDYAMTGYALTTDQVIQSLNQAKTRNQIVSTGSCR